MWVETRITQPAVKVIDVLSHLHVPDHQRALRCHWSTPSRARGNQRVLSVHLSGHVQ